MNKYVALASALSLSLVLAACTHTATTTPTPSPAAMMEETSETMMEEKNDTAMTEVTAVAGETLEIDSFMFGYSAKSIKVKAGETYTLQLTNSSGMHDFVVDELDIRTKIIKQGETDTITFTIPESEAGKSYKFYCSVMNHRAQGMEGDFIVE